MNVSDFRANTQRLIHSPMGSDVVLPARISQVPLLVFLLALLPTTPDRLSPASTHCFGRK